MEDLFSNTEFNSFPNCPRHQTKKFQAAIVCTKSDCNQYRLNCFKCLQQFHSDHFDQTEDIESFINRFKEFQSQNNPQKQRIAQLEELINQFENCKEILISKLNKFEYQMKAFLQQLKAPIIHSSQKKCNSMIFIEDMLFSAFGNEIYVFKKKLINDTKLPYYEFSKIIDISQSKNINCLQQAKNYLLSSGYENTIKIINIQRFTLLNQIQSKVSQVILTVQVLNELNYLIIAFANSLKIVQLLKQKQFGLGTKQTLNFNNKFISNAYISLKQPNTTTDNYFSAFGNDIGEIAQLFINEKEIKNLGLIPVFTKPLDHLCFQNNTNILFTGSSYLNQIKIFTLDINTQNLIFWKEIKVGFIGGICSLNNKIYFNYQEQNDDKVVIAKYEIESDFINILQTNVIPNEMKKNLKAKEDIDIYAGPIISQEPNILIRAIGYDIQLIYLAQ